MAEQVQQSAARSYRDQSGRDMARSLLILLIPILLVGAVLKACGSSDPTVVDTAAAIADARSAGLFPVLAPRGLGADWKPVQATFRHSDPTTGDLRLGYLSPSGGQLLMAESNEDPASLLSRELGDDTRPQGEVSIGGQPWTHALVRDDEQSLVRTEEGRTIIVEGRVDLDDLTTFAGSLS